MNTASVIEKARQQWDFLAIIVGMLGGFGAVAVTRMLAGPHASVWFVTALSAAFCASNVVLQRTRQRSRSAATANQGRIVGRFIEMARQQMDPVAIMMAVVAGFVGVAATRMILGPDANVWFGTALTAALLGAQVTLQRARRSSSDSEATAAK